MFESFFIIRKRSNKNFDFTIPYVGGGAVCEQAFVFQRKAEYAFRTNEGQNYCIISMY